MYLLQVNALVAAIVAGAVVAVSGLIFVSVFAWRSAKTYLAAQDRISQRLTALKRQPEPLTNSPKLRREFATLLGTNERSQRSLQRRPKTYRLADALLSSITAKEDLHNDSDPLRIRARETVNVNRYGHRRHERREET